LKFAIAATPRRSNGMRSLEAECSTRVQQCAAAVDEQHQRAAIDAWPAFLTGGVWNWGRNWAVKTNRLVRLFVNRITQKLKKEFIHEIFGNGS